MKFKLTTLININISIYIFTLYLFTYQSGLNIVSNVFAGSLIVLIWINHIFQHKKIVFNKFLLLFGLFIFFSVISLFTSMDVSVTMVSIRTLFLLYALIFSLVNYLDDTNKLRIVIKSFIYSGIIATLYILFTSDLSSLTRLGGQLGNVNAIGLNIAISAIFLLLLYYRSERLSYLFWMLLLVVMVILTGSRKSLIFVLLGIMFLSYIRFNTKASSKIKFLILFVPIIIGSIYLIYTIPAFYNVIGERFLNLYEGLFGGGTTEGSFNTRVLMTELGWNWFLDKPIFGYGLDNYRILYESYTGLNTYSHNNVIELLVGIGFLGTLFFYLGYLNVLIRLRKVAKTNEAKLLSYSFFAIIMGFVILSPSLVFYDGKIITIITTIGSVIPSIMISEGLNKKSVCERS